MDGDLIQKTDSNGCNMFRFDIVPPSDEYDESFFRNHLRFAGFERVGGDDDNNDEWRPLTVKRWAEFMASSSSSSKFKILAMCMTRLIRESPYQALFFETKGVTSISASSKQFEFVTVDAPRLYKFCQTHLDPDAFSDYLNPLPLTEPGASFSNLGGTAHLIAPKSWNEEQDEDGDDKNHMYAHLASFLRHAKEEQILGLWHMVGNEYLRSIQSSSSTNPVWLSTSGTGVAWLHFRLDQKPKYYTYMPFAKET